MTMMTIVSWESCTHRHECTHTHTHTHGTGMNWLLKWYHTTPRKPHHIIPHHTTQTTPCNTTPHHWSFFITCACMHASMALSISQPGTVYHTYTMSTRKMNHLIVLMKSHLHRHTSNILILMTDFFIRHKTTFFKQKISCNQGLNCVNKKSVEI